MLESLLKWADTLALAEVMRDSSWLYTFLLMWHFVGIALLFGAMLVADLRMLGVARRIPLDTALKFLPFALIGFGINAVTGFCFFVFQPYQLAGNWAFKIKVILIAIAGLNALYFTLVEDRKLKALAIQGGEPGAAIKVSAALSLTLWVLVIVAGRMIVAFQGSAELF